MSYNKRWLIKNRSEKLSEKFSENYSYVDSIYTDETRVEDDETINRDYEIHEENLPQKEREEITIEYKEKINPYHNSSIFSKIFFYWAFKIIKLSNRIRIQNEHFGKLSEENQSINFCAELKTFWEDKKFKDKENGVFKAMMAFNALELISCTLLWGMLVLLELLDVILFREFIETFNTNTEADVKKSVIIACFYFILKFFNEIITRYVWFYMTNLGLKTKYQLQGLAYDKLLKLTPASLNPKMSNGKIINIAIEDTDKFRVLVNSINDLVYGPIKIVIYSSLLLKYFGLSALFGIAVLLLSILANYFIFKWNMKALSERKLKKDSRIEFSNETLSNIKILKLYSWESKYNKKIKKERDEELELVKKSFVINSLNIANLNWMPVLISSVILGVYQYTDHRMNIQNVMTGMYIFNILRNAFRNLPVILEQNANGIVSFKRIHEFMNLDEINKSNIIKEEIDCSICHIERTHNDNINENSIDSLNLNILENASYVNIRYNEDDFLNNNNNMNNNNSNNHTFFNANNEDDNNVAIRIPNLSFSWGKTESKADSQMLSMMELDETNIEKNSQSNIYIDEDVYDKILEEDDDNLAAEEADYPIKENIPTTLKNINLKVKKGELIGIFGKTGSGKSSLVQAILNNMITVNHILSKDDKHYTNEKILIRGSIAYTSQTPWIENATLRENILFYSDFNEQKYNEIIRLCELESDFKQLPGGDFTEIGDKGVNLSGGQKSRISLARAVYSDKDIIVLDDPLSALDVQVGAKIMKNLICSYLHAKTRIMVTHAIHFLENCDHIINLNEGKVAWAGNAKALKNSLFYKKMLDNLNMKRQKEEEISRKNTIINEIDELINAKQESSNKEPEIPLANQNIENYNQNESVFVNTAISEVSASEASEEDSSCLGSIKNTSNELRNKIHKIISQEDREIGKVKLSVYLNYAKHLGGYFLTLLIFLLQIGWQILKVFADKWLITWTKQNTQETMWKNLVIYFALGSSSIVLMYISVIIIYYRSVNCSKSLHQLIISKLISAPISTFHETVPLGRIMNRLANDLGSVDTELSNRLIQFLSFFSTLIGVFIICGIYFPVSFTLLPVLLLVGYLISRFSDHCNRELNRLLQISLSPISHLTMETVSGSEVIRAFGQEEEFLKKFHLKLDSHYKIYLYASAVAAWFHLIMGIISSFLLAMFLVFSIYFREKFSQGTVALMLSYSVLFYQNVFQTLFSMRNFEIDLIKMERCLSFTKIPSESKMELKNDRELFSSNEESHDDSQNNSDNRLSTLERKQAAWPKEGFIEFRDYSVRYRPDTNIVLKNLNFKIHSGEKVGIIGRTGCGKSTLCLAMFRILEPETGSIFIDGVDICEIGLRTLRSSLTIIPQDPRLMRGTLRYNIDPFEAYSDEKIKEIMDTLKISYLMENPSGLNLRISESGANLSVGEKQLICIARALLKNSKIVIMDEATANLDFQTEQTIQNALNVLLKGATVLTIAHRIKTIINYDKILVLSKGKVKEFDSPHNLVKDKNTFFSKLVKRSKISFGKSNVVVNH